MCAALTVSTLTVPTIMVATLMMPTLMVPTLTVPKGADQCQLPDGAPWSTKCPFKHPLKKRQKCLWIPDLDPDLNLEAPKEPLGA